MSSNSAVATRPPGNGTAMSVVPVETNQDSAGELDLVRQTYAKELSPAEWQLFVAEARHRDLSIVKGEMAAIKRQGKVSHQVTIHGARRLATRSQQYADAEGPFWCGKDGVWVDIWLDEKIPPAAARFIVYRKDSEKPTVATALWSERKQTYWKDGKEFLMPTWQKMPAHMLAKVAESDALKRARLLVDEIDVNLEYEPKIRALRSLHAAGKARGLDHASVREVVKAIAPGVESLQEESVTPHVLNSATSFVESATDEEIAAAVTGTAELQPLPEDEFPDAEAPEATYAMSDGRTVDGATGEILDAPAAPRKAGKKTEKVEPANGTIQDPNVPSLASQHIAIRKLGVPKVGTDDLTTLCGGPLEDLTYEYAAGWIKFLTTATSADIQAEIASRGVEDSDGVDEQTEDNDEPLTKAEADYIRDHGTPEQQAKLMDDSEARRRQIFNALTN